MTLPGIFCEKSNQVKDGGFLLAPFKAFKGVSEVEYNSICSMSLEERLRLVEILRNGVNLLHCEEYVEDPEELLDAMLILGHHKQKEAFPFLLDLATVDEEVLEYTFGMDFLFEDLADLLSSTAHGRWEELKQTIEDVEPNIAVSSLLEAAERMVIERQVPLEPVMLFVKDYLARVIREQMNYNENLIYWIYTAIILWPGECLEEIKELLGVCAVDTDFIDIKDLLERYEEGSAGDIINAGIKPRPFVLIEGEEWDEEEEDSSIFEQKDRDESLLDEQLDTLQGERVGRNDPCLCGSGKKFKKCCLDKGREQLPGIEDYRITQEPGRADFQYEINQHELIDFDTIREHPEKCIEPLLQHIKAYPTRPTFYNHLCLCYLKVGRLWDARDILFKTLDLFPDYLFGLVEFAAYCIRRGEYQKAFEALKSSQTLKQLYPDRKVFHLCEVVAFHHIIGLYFTNIGNISQARVHLAVLDKFAEGSLQGKDLREKITSHLKRVKRNRANE